MRGKFPKITFVTSLIRPQNLGRIELSIFQSLLGKVAWNWVIVVDGKFVPSAMIIPPVHATVLYRIIPQKSYGFLEKNEALDHIEEDSWVTFLDDDMEVHPNLAPLFLKTLDEKPDAVAMAFGQQLPDGSVRAPKAGEDNYVSKIDMCQYLVKRSAIGQQRFLGPYNSDGEFFNRIYFENPGKVAFNPEVGFFHNNLRTEAWDPKVGHGRPY